MNNEMYQLIETLRGLKAARGVVKYPPSPWSPVQRVDNMSRIINSRIEKQISVDATTVAKKMELSLSHNIFDKITIQNQNEYWQFEYILKLCDWSASPILCNFWFGSND